MTSEMEALADAIAARLQKPALPVDVDLWDVSIIAGYLKVSASQVYQRYAPLPGFPQAIRLPTADGRKSHPRWKASEVIAWAEKHQERRAA